MTSAKIWPAAALIFGILIGIIGAVLIVTYVLEAVVARTDEADQSLLFWYLPILFFGIVGLVTGLSGVIWGLCRLKKVNQENGNG